MDHEPPTLDLVAIMIRVSRKKSTTALHKAATILPFITSTEIYLLSTMDIDESSVTGNAEVVEAIFKELDD